MNTPRWNKLTKEEQERRLVFQATAEEHLLVESEINYWNQYDISPDLGIPEQRLLDSVVEQLTPVYQQWIDKIASNPKTPMWAYPLFSVGAAKMADITFRVLMREWFSSNLWKNDDDSWILPLPTAQHIAHEISTLTIEIISFQYAKKTHKEDWLKQSHYQKNWTPRRCKAFAKKCSSLSKNTWTRKQRETFGHHMLRIAELSSVIQFIRKRQKHGKGYIERSYISFTESVLKELTSGHQNVIANASLIYRPMIVPPVEHTETSSGGALLTFIRKSVVQRFKEQGWDEDSPAKEQKNSTPGPICIRGANALSSVELAINEPVLQIMSSMFKDNCCMGNLPAYEFTAFDTGGEYPKDGPKDQQAAWIATRAAEWSKWYKQESLRCRMLVRLKLAQDLVHWGFFYHVYTMDFRGRAYSTCDLLSPQSSDFDRGLIHSANPIKQTPEGLYWLKVHLANLFDQDDGPFDERVKWVDSNMDMFRRVKKDPLGTTDFWCSNKEKKNTTWQRLAAIFDLLREDGLTSVYCFQDGTCNGVQHWAALVRSQTLATLTNLVPMDAPNDLYEFVANRTTDYFVDVLLLPQEHDPDTVNWAEKFLDHWDNCIPRPVVKRPVMTDPYGITFYGIRKYIREEKHLDWVPREQQASAIMELAIGIDTSLKGILEAPNEGKKWLKSVADYYSDKQELLKWTTPCGFTVVHRYNSYLVRRSVAKLFNMKELHFAYVDGDTVDKTSVNQAIAPNYIHSLDASHQWFVISRLLDAGITDMAFVHDAYGTLGPWVPLLRQFTLEEFYNMHKEPLLIDLQEQLKMKDILPVPCHLFPQDYDIADVLEARYAFQ